MATECNNKGIYPKAKGKRRKAAEMLVNPEFDGNISRLCTDIGVARSTLYRWLDESEFTGYLNWLIEKHSESELANVWRALISKAKTGSVEAIKLYFEMKGKYKQQVDISGGAVIIVEDELLE